MTTIDPNQTCPECDQSIVDHQELGDAIDGGEWTAGSCPVTGEVFVLPGLMKELEEK